MKNNAINTYGYAVYPCGKMPMHIVEITHERLAAFAVFSNAAAAREYINAEKARLAEYAPLAYDPDYNFNRALIDVYTSGSAGMFSKLENKQIYKAAV